MNDAIPKNGLGAASGAPLIARLRERAEPTVTTYQGCRLSWQCFGDGPPVVLLHGGHGSWLHWVRNIEPLAASHRLWVADMPGYGASDLPPGHSRQNASVAPLVDMLVDSIEQSIGRTQPVDLVGFSFGGLVATRVAERLGDAARHLVLLGPAGHGGPRRPRGELVNWRFAAHREDAEALRKAMHHNLAVHMLHHDGSIDELALAVHTESCMATRFRSKEISRSGGLVDLLARRVAAGASTSVFWGEHDVTADPRWVVEHVAPGKVQIVAGSGHWVQYEAADFINETLGQLLQ